MELLGKSDIGGGPPTVSLSLRGTMNCLAIACFVTLLFAGLQSEAGFPLPELQLSRGQAITVVSQLHLGMQEEKAIKHLKSSGFDRPLRVGCSHGWTCLYRLADGSSLRLDIEPVRARADGAWRNGLLRAAYIQKDGSNASIPLRPGSIPRPQTQWAEDWEIFGVILVGTCVLFGVALLAVERKAKLA
jgi:hypothetical protein